LIEIGEDWAGADKHVTCLLGGSLQSSLAEFAPICQIE
jgi:hypothetical protein